MYLGDCRKLSLANECDVTGFRENTNSKFCFRIFLAGFPESSFIHVGCDSGTD